MAYVSLYRKYRPQTFDEVIGQSHATQVLRHAIEEDRLHHAYLFTGPRGTGKTSTARILAKAVNCEQGPTSTPCNTCAQCVAITDGSSVDVVELDMASHGGVDDARELRERALFAPASARRKVYILDEVHMASSAAFNALLKLIEEPPAHVLFTMATTDPQKVIPTIMSRVQRLDMRRVSATDVGAHAVALAEREGYSLDEDAVDAVVRAGDGSVRDTLSILEQVLAFGSTGETITGEAVARVLGNTPVDKVFDAVDRIATQDVAGVMALVQGLLDDGHDLRRFALDLAGHVRDLLVLQVAPTRPDLVDATEERRARLLQQANVLGAESLLRAVDLLADALTEMRQSPPRLPLELTLAKLAMPATSGDTTALADRIARLEQGRPAPTTTPAKATAPPAPTAPPATPAAAAAPPDVEQAPPSPAPARSPRPVRAQAEHDTPSPAAASDEAATTAPPQAPPPAEEPHAEEPAKAPQAEEPPAEEPGAEAAPTTTSEPAEAAHREPTMAAPSQAPPPPAAQPEPAAPPEPPADADADAAPPEAPAADAPAPEAPAPDAVAPDAPPARATIDQIAGKWPAILDILRNESMRIYSIMNEGRPVELTSGTLVLAFQPKHAAFHAKNASQGEYADALQRAVKQACGLNVRIATTILQAGGAVPAAPAPSDAAPDPADLAAPPEVQAAVREAEYESARASVSTATDGSEDIGDLVVRELDATPLD